MSVPLHHVCWLGMAGLHRDKAPVEWPRSEAGTRLRGRCLHGCYGNQCHSDALCIATLAKDKDETHAQKRHGEDGLG